MPEQFSFVILTKLIMSLAGNVCSRNNFLSALSCPEQPKITGSQGVLKHEERRSVFLPPSHCSHCLVTNSQRAMRRQWCERKARVRKVRRGIGEAPGWALLGGGCSAF